VQGSCSFTCMARPTRAAHSRGRSYAPRRGFPILLALPHQCVPRLRNPTPYPCFDRENVTRTEETLL
jgi:hypothetical protein